MPVKELYKFDAVPNEGCITVLTLKHDNSPAGHPCVDLFGESWAEMLRLGTADRFTFPFSAYYKVVWAEDSDQKCVGFILYRTDMENEYWVCCSYTKPEWRRAGIYRELMQALGEKAREDGCLRITGGTSVRNVATQAAYAATGRVKKSETWALDL